MDRSMTLSIALSAALVVLAAARAVYHDVLVERMDVLFFGLLAAAVLVHVVPWRRIQSLKAGSVELTLNQPEVAGALASLPGVDDEALRRQLLRMGEAVASLRGARALWIDDHIEGLLAERRLLRALGVTIVPARSSNAAREILTGDNDFDLLITDVQRLGKSHEVTGGHEIHEGTNFVVLLKTKWPDPVVKTLPVVFYAAYEWKRLVSFTAAARELGSDIEIANTPADLIRKSVSILAETRARKLEVTPVKLPTDPRWDE